MKIIRKKSAGLLFLIVLVCLPAGLLLADGLIVIPHPPIWPPPRPLPRPVPPPPGPFPLEVKYHHVSVRIKNQVATTRIEQSFYNPTAVRLEGLYLFPLPEGASIKNFSMEVDGKMVQAELLEASRAREIYEDIVRRLKDPALLEYAGQGTFKLRIFPIEARGEKRIVISYMEVLRAEAGLFTYRYPLNTEKFSARPIEEVSLKIELETDQPVKTVFCPSHQVEIKRKDDHHVQVGYEARQVKPDQDLLLSYGLATSPVGLHLLTHRLPGEDGYFLLNVSPGVESQRPALPKDLIFVVDTSGSMAGKKLEQLKKALLFCLDNLASQDRFNLIRFSTEAEALWPSLQTVSKTSVEKTRQMVEDFKAIGGTNIEAALSLALKEKQDQTRPCLIVFLTDGRPTVGETDTGRIIDKLKQANTGNRRIFTFGIGHDVNTHLLDRITELTRADRVYIHPEEDLEIKVSAFYEKISFPVLTDLQLDFGALGVSALYPAPLPDLFRGSQLMLLGRYRGAGKTLVRLTGQMEKERKEFTASFDFPAENRDNDFLPALWAAQHIGYLLDQMRLHGENSELKDEVVRLARKYGIITPYTSYLIVEDEKVRIAEGRLRREEATLSAIPMADRTLEKRMAADYQGLGQVTGAGSVRASQEVQALKQATSFSHVSQGKERLAYVDSDGQMKNLAQQVKYVGGRAFYQVENAWVDSLLPLAKNLPVRKIQFASAEYFQLLKQQPEVNRILALGKTVSFVFQNQIYQISE